MRWAMSMEPSRSASPATRRQQFRLADVERHQDAFPPSQLRGRPAGAVHRLDSVAADVLRTNDIAFLKIDVQGFEKQVIAGGDSQQCTTDASACSSSCLSAVVRGGMLIREASISWIPLEGFTLSGLQPRFHRPRNGRYLQADGIFFRGSD